MQVAGFAAALGPIVSIGGRLVKAFAILRKFFLGKFLPALRLVAQVLMKLTPQGRIVSGLIVAASYLVTNWGKVKKGFDDLVDSTTTLLEKLGLLKKEEDLGLDFSIQEGEVLTPEEMMRRAAARQGVKIVPGKKPVQMSQEEREGRARMAKDKADALNLPSIEPIKVLGVELDKIPKKLDTIEEKFESSFDDVETYFDRLSRISESIGRVLKAGADNFKSFAEQVKSSVRSAIGALIAEGVAAAISTALKNPAISINPALIPVIAGLAGGLAKTAFNSLIPAFADGGIVSGPTLGIMGEYSGARTNPEVIAPLDKLKSMIGENGGGQVQVFGTISGQDILLSSDRARNNRNRTRGY